MQLQQFPAFPRWVGWLMVIGLLASIAVLFFPRKPAPPAPRAPIPSTPASTLPHRGGPPDYAGSVSCHECHPKEHQSWARSYHRSMTQVARSNTVVANFNDVQLQGAGERFTLRHKDNDFWFDIESIAESGAIETNDVRRLPVELVTGSHHMQVFWVPSGKGNMQVGFPFTWLIDERRWVPRNDAFIRDPHSAPGLEVWNLTCIRCHTTMPQPRPDRERELFDTRVVELGISCEACHGPAGPHVAKQRAVIGKVPAAEAVDTTIVQPAKLDHVRSSQICGFCHSIKWFDDAEGWKEHGFRFRPGDDLQQTTPVVRPTELQSQPWLRNVLQKNPDLLADFFWPDGMIRVAGREFNGLIESPCYQRGELSCLSCHSMHASEPNDQLARGMEGNRACVQCHAAIGQKLEAHTRHSATSTGSLCYNCHMPHTAYALLKAIRSHQIDSPRVQTSLASGRPLACNLCHVDKTLAWSAQHLTDWYGHPRPALSADQQATAAAILSALTGDAGQRALAAWSLGWESARAVADDTWQAPVLAALLDDPYSAVRFIAYRSLRQLPGFNLFPYDFVGAPEQRSAASRRALEQWQKQAGARSRMEPQLLRLPDGAFHAAAAADLYQRRNERPVRLRE